MLKFKDSNGNVIAELADDDSEPVMYSEQDKKKKKSKKSQAKKQMSVYERPLIEQQDPSYIASGVGPGGNGGVNGTRGGKAC